MTARKNSRVSDVSSEDAAADTQLVPVRPQIINILCSVKFVIIALVLSLVLCIFAVTGTWSAIDVMTMNNLSSALRQQTIVQISNLLMARTLPIKTYGQLVLTGIHSGQLNPDAGI
jgi:hypothetical protein